MKWCFIVAPIPSTIEFLGKLASQVVSEGDECFLLANSKIAEYSTRPHFPKEAKMFSQIDWCIKNYKENQEDFNDLSWKDFFPDYERFRLFKFGYQKSRKMLSQLYQFIDFVLKNEKPDVVMYEAPSGASSEIAYHLCQKYNILYLGLIGSKIKGRIDIYDLEHTCSFYERDFKKINNLSEEEKIFAREFIEKFINHKELPPYMEYQPSSRDKLVYFKEYLQQSAKMWPFWLKYILWRNQFKTFDFGSEILLKSQLKYPFRALLIRIKKALQGNVYSSLNENDKYFLFPLHIQPEASTLVLATYFYEQVNTVKNVAFSLPFPYKLYVKEHPAVRGDRPKNFYKKLKAIPNVVLISPFENTENLIKRSKGVITLTSTIGLEAALTGKPIYVLGNVFYSYHPLCQKVNSFEELKQKIEMDLIRKPDIDDLEDINLRFILSYFKNTIAGAGEVAATISENDTNDYKAIYKEIKRMFLK